MEEFLSPSKKARQQILEILKPLSYSEAEYVLRRTVEEIEESKEAFEEKVTLEEIMDRSKNK